MKKVPLLVGLGLLLFSPTAGAWPLPPPLETAHLLGKGLPSGKPPVPLEDELYALGWSPANTFAFMERRTMEGGFRTTRFRVFDVVEDRVLFEVEWPDWGTEDKKAAWWSDREAEVDTIFVRYALKPTSWQMGVFPLILDNEYYTLALRTFPNTSDPGWTDRLEILVHSTGRGLKTVQDSEGYWRWAALLGFSPSPFENRVALVLVVQPAGWRGNDQPLRFLVLGLSLKAGFPKP